MGRVTNGDIPSRVGDVRFSTKCLNYIDRHPRVGWYVAGWAVLITADAVWGIVDKIL